MLRLESYCGLSTLDDTFDLILEDAMKPEKIEAGQVWRSDKGTGTVRVVREVNASRDEVWFTSNTWISISDLIKDYAFVGAIGRDDQLLCPTNAPTELVPGQVWCRNNDRSVVVITELHGKYGVVAPDHEMSLDFLNRHYTCVGRLADNYLLRARPAVDFNVMKHAMRMQADKMAT
jgi:hypothetical protein